MKRIDVGTVMTLALVLVGLGCTSKSGSSDAGEPPSGSTICDGNKSVEFIEKIFPSDAAWDEVFAVAKKDQACNGKSILTRANFLVAAAKYPEFCGSSSTAMNIQELAAFLGNASLETNGAAAGTYDGGLCYASEAACTPYPAQCAKSACDYCSTVNPPWNAAPACPCGYIGRGALQITNPYNYHEASMELFGDDRLYQQPESILEGTVAWEASVAFWMNHSGGLSSSKTTIQGTTTCHAAIIGGTRDFGKTIEVINGNIECNKPKPDYRKRTKGRIGYYQEYVKTFSSACGISLEPTENLDCAEDLPPPDPKSTRCGTSWTAANAVCGTLCTVPEDCQTGENCFDDLDSSRCD